MSTSHASIEQANPPSGFQFFKRGESPFNQSMMPMWTQRDEMDYSIGLRLEKKHCNYQLFMHGGAVAALADVAMGNAMQSEERVDVHAATASLTVDYIGSAKIGEWVQATAKILKKGRRMIFVECLLTVGLDIGKPKIVARANATFIPVRTPEERAASGHAPAPSRARDASHAGQLAPPPGFRPFLTTAAPFDDNLSPLLFKRDGTDYSMGMRLEKKHCNYQRTIHGGAVATLADMVMGLVHRRSGEPRVHTVTASMTVDYIGGAKVGEWVEGTAKVLKQGRRLYFSECLITAGKDVGEPRIIARGSASYMPVRGPDGG
jgi:uncharacterized protein (TIGR00369 family)